MQLKPSLLETLLNALAPPPISRVAKPQFLRHLLHLLYDQFASFREFRHLSRHQVVDLGLVSCERLHLGVMSQLFGRLRSAPERTCDQRSVQRTVPCAQRDTVPCRVTGHEQVPPTLGVNVQEDTPTRLGPPKRYTR